MDYLQLLLADRIRVRAGEFRNQARSRKLDEIEAAGGDEKAEIAIWEKATYSDEFIAMAYDELIRVSKITAKLMETSKRKLPTLPDPIDEAQPEGEGAQ